MAKYAETYTERKFVQQPVAQISEDVFFSVPWGHHLYIISQCKDVERAVFYLNKTVENGWSRAVLLNFLDTRSEEHTSELQSQR